MKKLRDFIRFNGDNIYPDGIEAEEALEVLKQFFLSDNWYIVDPVGVKQSYVYIVDAILSQHPFKYRKFARKNGWIK